MIEQFNKILQKFGWHRLRLEHVQSDRVLFSINRTGEFIIYENRYLAEVVGSECKTTAKSKWLQAVSLGMTRNDAGEVA